MAFILDEKIHSKNNLKISMTSFPIIPPTKRIVDFIDVEGREGNLILLKGWEDLSIIFKAAIHDKSKWNEVLSKIINAQKITFTNESTVHFKIKHTQVSGLNRLLSNLWEFEIELVCAPFRYINDVATLVRTSSGTVASHGNIYALPRIKVFGTGKRTLTINGKAIVLDLQSEYLIIDSELKECYYGNVATNHLMTGDFPIFNIGNNQVTLGTGITKIEIEPRWRYL